MFLCYYIFNLEYGSISIISTDFVDYCIFKLQDGGTYVVYNSIFLSRKKQKKKDYIRRLRY